MRADTLDCDLYQEPSRATTRPIQVKSTHKSPLQSTKVPNLTLKTPFDRCLIAFAYTHQADSSSNPIALDQSISTTVLSSAYACSKSLTC